MQIRNILVLIVLAAGLLAVVALQSDEAERDPDGLEDFAVFAGIDPDRIRVLTIDHAERNWQARLERDDRDLWLMTDPVAYPAEASSVKRLLDQVRNLRGEAVIGLDDAAKVGLDPPRARVSVTTRDEDGNEVVVAVDLGAIDLDGDGMYVRVNDRVLRARRTLDNALLGGVDDYRSKSLVNISPLERPIEVVRSGELDGRDLGFEALLDGIHWMAARPVRATLDPLTVHLFLQQLVGGRLKRFHSDDPAPLATYGLEDPVLRIEMATVRDSRAALRMGRPSDEGPWFCVREGYPFVWEVEDRTVRVLATPFEDLLDYRIVRAKRAQVQELVLESGGTPRRIYRVGGQWRMTGDLESDAADVEDFLLADEGAVSDLLAVLEGAELAAYLPPDVAFVPLDPPQRLSVATAGGDVFGGELGAFHAVQGSEGGHTFRRDGDDLVALVDQEIAELVTTELDELRSLALHKLVEREQNAVVLRRGGEEFVYVLDRRANVWQAAGTTLEAREFAVLVDRLLSMRARRFLGPEEVVDASDAIEVEIQSASGLPVRFRLVATEDGRELVEKDGEWSEVRTGSYERLAALF